MSAVIPRNANTRQLDRQAEPAEQVRPEDVQDPTRLARVVMRLLRDVAVLKRRFWPEFLEHEDVVFDGTGTTVYRLPHGFSQRVRWWVTDWSGATAGPRLVRHASADLSTLALVSYTAGTGTIRITGAG
ncbi:MAG: hypothetical protein ACRCU1_11565 [Alsobacter sp.]